MAVALSQQEQEELDAFNKAIGDGSEEPANEPAQAASEAPTKESEPATDDAQPAPEQPEGERSEPVDGGQPGGEPAADAPQGTPPAPSDETQQAPAAQPPSEAPPDVKTLAEQVAALRAELDAERQAKAQRDVAPEGIPSSSSTSPEEAASEEQPAPEFVYSDEQKAAIEWLESEFPDIKKAVDAREAALRHHFEQQTTGALKDFAKQVVQWLDPLVGTHRQSLQEQHLAAVRGAVPEYDEIVDHLPDWIAKQPGAIGESWKRVYESGTTDEVIALLQTFKASTGRASPPQEQGTDPRAAASPQATPAAPPADKVHALTAVRGGGRTTPKPSAGSKPEMTEEEAFNLAIGMAPK